MCSFLTDFCKPLYKPLEPEKLTNGKQFLIKYRPIAISHPHICAFISGIKRDNNNSLKLHHADIITKLTWHFSVTLQIVSTSHDDAFILFYTRYHPYAILRRMSNSLWELNNITIHLYLYYSHYLYLSCIFV